MCRIMNLFIQREQRAVDGFANSSDLNYEVVREFLGLITFNPSDLEFTVY